MTKMRVIVYEEVTYVYVVEAGQPQEAIEQALAQHLEEGGAQEVNVEARRAWVQN